MKRKWFRNIKNSFKIYNYDINHLIIKEIFIIINY